jgi:hypothetical protein
MTPCQGTKLSHGFQEVFVGRKKHTLEGPMSRVATGVKRSGSNNPIEEITMSTTGSKSSEVEAMGCPQLVPITQNLLAFNRRTSQPLGTLPQFPITLEGKTVFIDVMVVQDPLDFSLLLGRDYVYAMKAIVSTLFRVIYFPHDVWVETVDQLSFIDPAWIASLNGSYM